MCADLRIDLSLCPQVQTNAMTDRLSPEGRLNQGAKLGYLSLDRGHEKESFRAEGNEERAFDTPFELIAREDVAAGSAKKWAGRSWNGGSNP